MKRNLPRILLNAALLAALMVVLGPLLWMISASLLPDGGATRVPPVFIPRDPTLAQYRELFSRMAFGRYFLNSLLVASTVTVGSLVVNSMAAFAFAKYRFAGKDQLFAVLLALLVVPGQVTMFPVFLLLNKMGLTNHFGGLIIPGLSSIFAIFLFRQFMMSLPDSLIEAARIDGCDDFTIYARIVMPLCLPIVVTLALFTFLGTWNDFLWPLILMSDSARFTLPVALANLVGEHQSDTELMMAGAVITTLPVMIVFLALQRYYIQGITAGGVKE